MAAADIPALVRRMRGGGSRVGQLQAAKRLLNIFWLTHLEGVSAARHPGAAAAQQAACAAAGGIEAAVQLVQNGTPAMRNTALQLLGGVCADNAQCADALVAAGGIPVLLGMLQPGWLSSEAKSVEAAALALVYALQQSGAAGQAAAEAGGIDVLVQLLQVCQQQPQLGEHHTAAVASGQAAAEAGGIDVLVQLLQVCQQQPQLGEHHTAAVASRGAIEALVRLLSACQQDCPASGAVAATLETLCRRSAERTAALVLAGGVPALVRCLGNPRQDAQNNAAVLLRCLLVACPTVRAAVIAAGGDRQLQLLLGSSNADVRQRAAETLASLAAAAHQQAGAAPQETNAPAQPTRPPRICAAPGCGSTNGLRRCGGCGAVRYCSLECSRAHWRAHKDECRRLQAEREAAQANALP